MNYIIIKQDHVKEKGTQHIHTHAHKHTIHRYITKSIHITHVSKYCSTFMIFDRKIFWHLSNDQNNFSSLPSFVYSILCRSLLLNSRRSDYNCAPISKTNALTHIQSKERNKEKAAENLVDSTLIYLVYSNSLTS